MTDYKPGTVAIVTMRRPDEWESDLESGPYLAFYDGYHKRWISAEAGDLSPEGAFWVYEVKPLVVLDLDASPFAPSRATSAAEWLRAVAEAATREKGSLPDASSPNVRLVRWVADQIAEQVETPPRIAEPTEPLAEVRASTKTLGRRKFVRGWVGGISGGQARWVDGTTSYGWAELIDPTLVTEGLS